MREAANPIPDAEARERALDTAASFLVEAPAGSGKTGLLIQRFLKLLAIVDDPAAILAITFTRKATAEMRDRVLAQLAAVRTQAEPANAFDRATRPFARAALARSDAFGWALLDDPRRLNIRTIDSLCAEIARGLPVLSSSGGGLAPTDNAALLHAEAARRTLMLLGDPDLALSHALETVLLHRDGNLANCEKLIAGMLATRDQWGELIPLSGEELTDEFLDNEVLPQLDRALELAVCRALTRLQQLVPPALLAQLSALAAEMAEAEGYKGSPNPLALCRNRRQPPAERAHDLEHWHALIHLLVKPSPPRDWRKSVGRNNVGFEILKHHQAELKEIIADLNAAGPNILDELCRIEALPPAQYPRDQWPTAKALFRVLSRALVELQFVFAAHGQSDFTEAALEARAALRRPGAAGELRASRLLALEHLLVDEMQDTSTSQYELIQLLTQGFDGAAQTVFLVGDPKQSIYLFRQARVERFVQTMRSGRLGELGGLQVQPLHLTANFRSQATLVADFNTTFTPLFPPAPDPTRPEAVPYRQAHPIRPPALDSEAQTWHTAILPYTPDTTLRAQLRRTQMLAEAAEIRRILLHHRAASPTRTIAVLVRNRTHLLEIIAALKTAPPIPYRAVNIEPLGERREILDLLALTRALLHPADRTAWLALLRTPWVGLTLADLHRLASSESENQAETLRQTPVLDLIATRGDLLSPDGIARLEPFWPILLAALAQRTRQPLARTVERTWRSFNAHLYATPEQAQNITRYLELLDELERQSPFGQGTVDLPTLTARLAQLYATPPPTQGAVDLSTIHGAKGLEWDVVLVPALGAPGRNQQGRLLSWLETDSGDEPGSGSEPVAPGILAPIQARGLPAQRLKAWLDSIEANRAAAERTRLFYVACTRAREELHLFATLTRRANGSLAPTANTLLEAAWPAAELHFAHPTIELPLLQPATLDLAAATAPPTTRTIERIPLRVSRDQQSEAGVIAGGVPGSSPPIHQANPQTIAGSFQARALGNTLHAFLEQLAAHIAQGTPAPDLRAELPGWLPRITVVLRTAGLAPAAARSLATDVLRGLENTLSSPDGLWLLQPHAHAAAESAFTTLSPQGTPQTLRLDRTFFAGPGPGAPGETHRWIVDYKTSTHGQSNLAAFLAEEQQRYRPQLDGYAQALATPPANTRLALFFPLLPHLLWWQPEEDPRR